MKMDIKNMVRDFASLGEAKKRSSVYVKAVSAFRPYSSSGGISLLMMS